MRMPRKSLAMPVVLTESPVHLEFRSLNPEATRLVGRAVGWDKNPGAISLEAL